MTLPSIVLPFFWREGRFGNQLDKYGVDEFNSVRNFGAETL